MPNGIPAPATAEGLTQHTPNQGDALMAGLDPDQIMMLREAIEAWRVGDDGKGHSAMEHWDVRRTLIRVFGIGGFDIIQVTPPELIAVQEIPNGNASPKYTVIYRALCRLVIRDRRGRQLAVFEDGAIDEGLKQPSLTQAHDQGYKGAMSSALKRCAMNLGDQFGLSLYNKGSLVPVVYTPADRYRDMAVDAWDDFQEISRIYGMAQVDEILGQKVWDHDRAAMVALGVLLRRRGSELKPKQEDASPQPQASVPAQAQTEPQHTRPAEQQPAEPAAQGGQDEPLEALMGKVRNGWGSADAMRQNLLEGKHRGLLDVMVPSKNGPVKFGDLMENRITELEAQHQHERSAA